MSVSGHGRTSVDSSELGGTRGNLSILLQDRMRTRKTENSECYAGIPNFVREGWGRSIRVS